MSDFDKAIKFTLKWEGGETYDTGGHTKYGISKKAHADVDIANLTIEKAKDIYKKEYWDKIASVEIVEIYKDADYLIALFDTAVNVGVGRALEWAKICWSIDDLLFKRLEHYANLAKSPRYGLYLKGWLNRVIDLRNYIDKLDGEP